MRAKQEFSKIAMIDTQEFYNSFNILLSKLNIKAISSETST